MKSRRIKKAVAFVLTAAMALSFSSVMAFAGEGGSDYVVKNWVTEGGYGSAEATDDDNVTILKGADEFDASNNAFTGPYTKENVMKLGTGIIKEVNVLIDPDAATKENNTLFVVSSELEKSATEDMDNARREIIVGAFKTGDGNVVIKGQPEGASGVGEYVVDRRDVYTIRFEYRLDANGISADAYLYDRSGNNVCTLVDNTWALNEGEATAAADYQSGYVWFVGINAADGIKVYNEVPQDSISLDAAEFALTVGDTGKLTATVGPEFLEDKTVTWTSSDESIATVDENGIIKALAAGKTTITATFNGVSAECLLTVSEKTAPGTDEGNNDGTTAGTENKATENSPKTGDDFNMIVPIMLMIATAAGAGAVFIHRRHNA